MKKFFKDIKFKLFRWLLQDFVTHELDQWERWEIPTKYGPVYVEITRQSDGYHYEKWVTSILGEE